MIEIGLMETRLNTTNATTTTQKQSDCRVEQSSFTLIALFRLEIGRCRGRNWPNGNQALPDCVTTLPLQIVCVHVVRRFSKDFSEVRGLRSRGFQLQVECMTTVLCADL